MKFHKREKFFTSNPRLQIKRQKFDNGQEGATLTGYAIVWNELSSDRGGYFVRLLPNSATFTSPALALWHHDYSKPLAGTNNGTLRIGQADETGVPVEIDLDLNTSAGKDTLAYVASGLVAGMSFSMVDFGDYAEVEQDGKNIVEFSSFTSDEVTITPIPAFVQTSIEPKQDEPEPDELPPTPGGMSRITEAGIKLARLKIENLKHI